ncbi:hypothetical protein EV401DRAFT_2198377 [Pisolithus croceorrhizus]|nr:hypothetical protein EV401DRAFT_2198377 [Pisolithus croceorrhizus]
MHRIDKTTSSAPSQPRISCWRSTSPSSPGTLHIILQEPLAPKVIFFFDSEWKPYLGNSGTDHKESTEIVQELVDVIQSPRGNIVTFFPARPHYGERAGDLGHFLEEIVVRFGEVAVLAWSGKPSSHDNCLPASISIYNQTPYGPPSLEGEEMESYIAELRAFQLAVCIFLASSSLSENSVNKRDIVAMRTYIIPRPSSEVSGENDSEADSDTGSDWDGVASSHFGVAVPQIIAHLGQPFNVLLLVEQPDGEDYRGG